MADQRPDDMLPWNRPGPSGSRPTPGWAPRRTSGARSAEIRKLNKVTAVAVSAAVASILAVGTGIVAANAVEVWASGNDSSSTQSGIVSGSSDDTAEADTDDQSDESPWSVLGLRNESDAGSSGDGSTSGGQRNSPNNHGSSGQS
ncbi:MAG: hypothetical protein HQ526_05950 [Actinobacteria bacterium]|nr:hypothetical protein [Actinomycetota bacterium]